MSQSTGSDANPGSQALPIKTIGRLNGIRFIPGDRIFFKAGDTWTGETFNPVGFGTYALSTYSSTFTSTLATNTATYQGGAVYTAYHGTLVSDGQVDPAAQTIANDYCTRIAREDAIRAAHAAADAASTWILIDSYGAGARPKIAPGGSALYAIKFPIAAGSGGSLGWKIQNIDFDSCKVAAIHAEVLGATPETRKFYGLWLKNIKITNVTGGNIDTTGTNYAANSGTVGFYPGAICTVHVNNMVWDTVEVANSDSIGTVWAPDGLWITNPNWHDTFVNGLTLGGIANAAPQITGATYATPVSNLLVEGGTISNIGYTTGWPKGQAGVVAANIRDFSVKSVEITLVQINSADGVAFDFEGNTGPDQSGNVIPWTGIIRLCNFHGNDGPAFLHNGNTSQGSNPASRLFFDANTLASNGTSGLPAIIGQRTGLSDNNLVFTSNDTALVTAGQKLFAGDATHVYSPLTDTPPAGYIYGASNTKHFP